MKPNTNLAVIPHNYSPSLQEWGLKREKESILIFILWQFFNEPYSSPTHPPNAFSLGLKIGIINVVKEKRSSMITWFHICLFLQIKTNEPEAVRHSAWEFHYELNGLASKNNSSYNR